MTSRSTPAGTAPSNAGRSAPAPFTVDNTTGTYDVAATPTDPAVLSFRPGRQIRVGIAFDGGDTALVGALVHRRRQPHL